MECEKLNINLLFTKILRMFLLDELKKYKCKVSNNEDTRYLMNKYLKARKRFFVTSRKFEVIKSKTFISKSHMLTKEQKNAVADIIERMTMGRSLMPYFSNSEYLSKTLKEDELMEKHCIYHMHLGFCGAKEKFVKRTGKLLFFTYDDEHIYLLDIKNHPVGEGWLDDDIIAIAGEYLINSNSQSMFKDVDEVMDILSSSDFNNKLQELDEMKNVEVIESLKEIKGENSFDFTSFREHKHIKNAIIKLILDSIYF